MWAGWCFANWRTDSLPRPAVPVVFVNNIGRLPLEQVKGCVPPVTKMTFPARLGMSVVGLN